jgi:hypothetical protein
MRLMLKRLDTQLIELAFRRLKYPLIHSFLPYSMAFSSIIERKLDGVVPGALPPTKGLYR